MVFTKPDDDEHRKSPFLSFIRPRDIPSGTYPGLAFRLATGFKFLA